MALITMGLTALIHRLVHIMHNYLDHHLGRMTLTSQKKERQEMARLDSFTWKNHVIIVGFNETGLDIAEHFREQQQDVVVIDLDWKLHQVLEASYKDAHRDMDGENSVHPPTSGPFLQQSFMPAPPVMFAGQHMNMFPGQPMGYHMMGRAFGAEDVAEEEQEEESYLASGAAFGGQDYMPMTMASQSPIPGMAQAMGITSPGRMVVSLSSPFTLSPGFLCAHTHQFLADMAMRFQDPVLDWFRTCSAVTGACRTT
jgi:hypothetical protein